MGASALPACPRLGRAAFFKANQEKRLGHVIRERGAWECGGGPGHRAPSDLALHRSVLTAALGFALRDTKGKPAPKEIQLVPEWRDNWKGLGHVVTGMQRQRFKLHLTNVEGETWRATFSGSLTLAHRASVRARHHGGRFRGAAWEAVETPSKPEAVGRAQRRHRQSSVSGWSHRPA